MTNINIFKTSLSLTSTKVQLWILGIFLSSGFNFHWWYIMAWFKKSGFVSGVRSNLEENNIFVVLIFLFAFFVVSLLVVNIIKIYFFGLVHSYIHRTEDQLCLLCSQVNTEKDFKKIFFRADVVWRVCLASLITIGLTSATLGLFNFYNSHADVNLITQIVLLASMVIVLVGISLWNLICVLLILFYNFSFPKAGSFALDLMTMHFKRIAGFTIVLTTIFLFAVTAGALVISKIPEIFGITSSVLLTENLQFAWYAMIAVVSIVVLIAWIVLNNVFFNISLIIFIDSLIRVTKSEQKSSVLDSTPVKQAVTHHAEIEP